MRYKITHSVLAALSMLTMLRDPELLALLNGYIEPLRLTYNSFMAYKKDADYRLSHNSQVCYMRGMLNDSFDNTFRRIVINNAEVKEPNWFYEEIDNKPVLFYEEDDFKPVYFYEESDYGINRPDFTVILPLPIKPNNQDEELKLLTEMRAKIDSYKLYSKNYTIIWTN